MALLSFYLCVVVLAYNATVLKIYKEISLGVKRWLGYFLCCYSKKNYPAERYRPNSTIMGSKRTLAVLVYCETDY